MAQAVGRPPLTAEASVRLQVSPCEVCCRESGTGTGPPHYFSFPLSVSFHQCPTLIFICMLLLARRTNGWCLGTFQNVTLFRKSGSIGQKYLRYFSRLWN